MKKCSYCGKEYTDQAAFCSIDGEPLGSGIVRPRNPLRGSRRLWSAIAIGIFCAFVGGVLIWQKPNVLNGFGQVIIGFGIAWIIAAVQESKQKVDEGKK